MKSANLPCSSSTARIAVSGITQSLHIRGADVIRVARDLASPLRHRLLLGIEAIIGQEMVRYEHRYPRRTSILLIFYSVTEFTGEPKSLAFEQIRWELPEKLPGYDFLDGDIDFVRRIAAREF